MLSQKAAKAIIKHRHFILNDSQHRSCVGNKECLTGGVRKRGNAVPYFREKCQTWILRTFYLLNGIPCQLILAHIRGVKNCALFAYGN